GKTMAAASMFGIQLWDLATGKPTRVDDEPLEVPRSVVFSADRSRLACVSGSGLRVVDLATGRILQRDPDPDLHYLSLGPDHSVHALRIPSAGKKQTALLRWEPTGEPDDIVAVPFREPRAVSADLRWVAGTDGDRVWLFDRAAKREAEAAAGYRLEAFTP